MDKFSKALDKSNAPKKSDTEIEMSLMSAPKSTQKTIPQGTTLPPSNELLSPREKESTKVGTVKEERDLSIKHN